MSRLRPWARTLFAFAVLTILPCLLFSPWLQPYQLPQRGGPEHSFRAGDLTPLFYVWCTVIKRELWQGGSFPLWSDHIYCGEPFFAKAQVGVLSLTTLALALLPAELVATWTFLAHLALAGILTYVASGFLLDFLDGPAPHTAENMWARLGAALTYQTSALLIEHTTQGHGPIVLAACYTPLILVATVWAALRRRAFLAGTSLAGLLLAVQFLAGGATMTLYSALGVAVLAGALSLAPLLQPSRVSFGACFRPAAAALVVAVVGASVAAVKLLPAQALMPVSNRAGGLDPRVASLPIIEFPMPYVLVPLDPTGSAYDGPLLAGPLSLAALAFAGRRQRATRVALLLTGLVGAIVATRPEAFFLLHRFFPGFQYQRIPQRSLVLFYASLALLTGPGIAILLVGVRRIAATGSLRGRLFISASGLLACALSCGEHLTARSPLPPTRDIRTEQHANKLMQYVAGLPGPFRFHQVESRDRNWGVEHVATPLGIEMFVGWDHMWLLDYLGAEGIVGRDVLPYVEASYRARHPTRFWAIANVRWVSATQDPPAIVDTYPGGRPRLRPLPGLTLHRVFENSPICQPDKSDGPYLYSVSPPLPRARFVPRAIVVVGDRATRRLAAYRLMDADRFDPRTLAVLELEPHASGDLTALPAVQAVVLARRTGTSPDVNIRLPGGLTAVEWDPWTESVPDRLLEVIQSPRDRNLSETKVEYARHNNWHRTVSCDTEQPGYIVLSEKFASFPGWKVGPNSRPLLVAYGVFTALPVEHGRHTIDLIYDPPGFRAGTWISCLAVSGALLLVVVGWRRCRCVRPPAGERGCSLPGAPHSV